jgi:hypothetical protein
MESEPTDEIEFVKPIMSQSSGKAYAPKWLHPKCGARFGFGGRLVTFQSNCIKLHTQVVAPSETAMTKLFQDFDKEL